MIFNKSVLAVILAKPIYCCKVGVAGAAYHSSNSRFAMLEIYNLSFKKSIIKNISVDAIFGGSYDNNYINELQAFGKNLSGVKRFMIRTTDEYN